MHASETFVPLNRPGPVRVANWIFAGCVAMATIALLLAFRETAQSIAADRWVISRATLLVAGCAGLGSWCFFGYLLLKLNQGAQWARTMLTITMVGSVVVSLLMLVSAGPAASFGQQTSLPWWWLGWLAQMIAVGLLYAPGVGAWLRTASAAQKIARRDIQGLVGNGSLTVPIAVAILIPVLGMAFNALSPRLVVAPRPSVPLTTRRAAPIVIGSSHGRAPTFSTVVHVGIPVPQGSRRVYSVPYGVQTHAGSVTLPPRAGVPPADVRTANAPLHPAQALKIKIGDTEDIVRAVYGDAVNGYSPALGLWVLFDGERKVSNVRIDLDDSAFGVDGIARGAALADCVSVWGKPYKVVSLGPAVANFFHRRDGSTVRVDISGGRLQYLLLSK